jgi:hypothetical protein
MTPNLFESPGKEEFKLQLNERFTLDHLVLKDGMELLKLAQRDGMGSLANYGMISVEC